MIASTEHKSYQKLIKSGKGSILKGIRTDKGCGKGVIAGGIVFLVVALLFGVPVMVINMIGGLSLAAIFGVPGLLMIAIGIPAKRKRESTWVSYYQETTGFTEVELQQIDRELASSSVRLVMCRYPNTTTEAYIACFVTEHYMVMNSVEPYIQRLEDIIAVAFSNSTDIWSMISLAKQDKEVVSHGLITDTARKPALCEEIMQELYRKNPKILCGQEIVCEGKHYILERDGAEILRLYKEGRTLELA